MVNGKIIPKFRVKGHICLQGFANPIKWKSSMAKYCSTINTWLQLNSRANMMSFVGHAAIRLVWSILLLSKGLC